MCFPAYFLKYLRTPSDDCFWPLKACKWVKIVSVSSEGFLVIAIIIVYLNS